MEGTRHDPAIVRVLLDARCGALGVPSGVSLVRAGRAGRDSSDEETFTITATCDTKELYGTVSGQRQFTVVHN